MRKKIFYKLKIKDYYKKNKYILNKINKFKIYKNNLKSGFKKK